MRTTLLILLLLILSCKKEIIVEGEENSNSPEIKQALARLNVELFDISQLYQSYAEPFELWESQLAILHCAGHHEPMLVETMWKNIIEAELKRSEELSVNSRLAMIGNKIKALGKLYSGAQKYFPLGLKNNL